MMDSSKLTERLRGIIGGTSPLPAKQPERACAEPTIPSGSQADIASVLGGEWQSAGGGRCLVVERRFDAATTHGCDCVSAFHMRITEALESAPLLSGGSAVDGPLAFFDLETTGLSGGAGTYAFLIGCAWFDDRGGFVTRQYVLTRLADEPAVLRGFAGELGRAGALVSFNGKTFDAPLLETRYLYHRLAWPGAALPHLDMLHPARRFWGSRPQFDGERSTQNTRDTQNGFFSAGSASSALNVVSTASCSLGALERRVLGASRTGDVPGFEIPARYFEFVRSGDARPLSAVLEHNRVDLLSLAAVTARLMTLVHRGPEAADQPVESLALGRVYASAGMRNRATEAFRHALELARRRREWSWIAVEALRALARSARRHRCYEEAAEWWRELLRIAPCPRDAACEAHEALAVHHEHRLRDLQSARSFALRMLDEPARPAWADAVRHRLARIERKMGLLDL